MIAALAGGVGAAKLLLGFCHEIAPEEVTVIANTGDDLEWFGLRICPDLDTIAYTLSGRVNTATGWGFEGDTFECLKVLGEYGCDTWFQLGDRDLATHLYRTRLLRQNVCLSEVTSRICNALGVRSRLIPMTEAYAPTYVVTDSGELHLQEYLVLRQAQPRVKGLRYTNVERAAPAARVVESLRNADLVVICPSNPFISIGPILTVPGIRECLRCTQAPVVAVSPVVSGRALKGPAAKMLAELGYPVSALGVAQFYASLARVFVLDQRDAHLKEEIEGLGLKVLTADTLMHTLDDRRRLARRILEVL